MKDPIRLLEEGTELSPRERELLWTGRSMEPPPGAQEKIWTALNVQIAAGGAGGAGSGGDGGASGVGSSGAGSSGVSISGVIGGIKGAIIGIASVVTVAGAIAAYVMGSPAAPVKNPVVENPPQLEVWAAPSAEAPKEIVQNVPVPAAEEAKPEPAPSSSALANDKVAERVAVSNVSHAKPTPAPSSSAADPKHEHASRLREENQALADARAALRSGDAASALEKLDAAGGRFPEGVLAQEREVVAIEALARAGKSADASSRAKAFLQKYPTSPHAAKVRGFIQ